MRSFYPVALRGALTALCLLAIGCDAAADAAPDGAGVRTVVVNYGALRNTLETDGVIRRFGY